MPSVFLGRIYDKVRFQLAFQFIAGCLRVARRLPRRPAEESASPAGKTVAARFQRGGAAMGKAEAESARTMQGLAGGPLAARMRARRWLRRQYERRENAFQATHDISERIVGVSVGVAFRIADCRDPARPMGIFRDSMCAVTDCLLLFMTVDRRAAIGIGGAARRPALRLDHACRGGLDDGLDAGGDAELLPRIVGVEIDGALG